MKWDIPQGIWMIGSLNRGEHSGTFQFLFRVCAEQMTSDHTIVFNEYFITLPMLIGLVF